MEPARKFWIPLHFMGLLEASLSFSGLCRNSGGLNKPLVLQHTHIHIWTFQYFLQIWGMLPKVPRNLMEPLSQGIMKLLGSLVHIYILSCILQILGSQSIQGIDLPTVVIGEVIHQKQFLQEFCETTKAAQKTHICQLHPIVVVLGENTKWILLDIAWSVQICLETSS